jgi:hypothetical protein
MCCYLSNTPYLAAVVVEKDSKRRTPRARPLEPDRDGAHQRLHDLRTGKGRKAKCIVPRGARFFPHVVDRDKNTNPLWHRTRFYEVQSSTKAVSGDRFFAVGPPEASQQSNFPRKLEFCNAT